MTGSPRGIGAAIATLFAAAGAAVACIAPETIMTERNRELIPAAVRDQLRGSHPIRRLGTPEGVAQAALFLAAQRSSWISGITVDVAGGSVIAQGFAAAGLRTGRLTALAGSGSPPERPHHR